MIRVAIIEDHHVLTDALKLMLEYEADFEFAGSADSVASAQQLLASLKADVILLDVFLPDGNGLDLVPILKGADTDCKIVVFTGYPDENVLMRSVDLGVEGFITKDRSLPELFAGIRQVMRGEIIMPAEMLMGLVKRLGRERVYIEKDNKALDRLSPREHEILLALTLGKSGDDIADELNIAPLTVRTHIRNMMSKLGVHSRLEAVAFALSQGLIDFPNSTG